MMNDNYEQRIQQQIGQYADLEKLKKLPPIFRYWMQKYVVHKLEYVFKKRTNIDIYADAFERGIRQSDSPMPRILSLGCGEATLEIAIAKALRARGLDNFKFEAVELSKIRIERAVKASVDAGLSTHFNFSQVDLNTWDPDFSFSGVMAQHTLHHIVELERLFGFVRAHLEHMGEFVIVDMIGRNGHTRWPETLDLLEQFWKILPDKYKYNHQFRRTVDPYLNWDCSKVGFEGIRSQDILPLLLEHFEFSHFIGVGGFIDIIVDRGYGHNYDPGSEIDLAYVDLMAGYNDAMLEAGLIKPTMIFGICRNLGTCGDLAEICWNGQSARSSVRIY